MKVFFSFPVHIRCLGYVSMGLIPPSCWYYEGLLHLLVTENTPVILLFYVVVHPNMYSYSLGGLFPFGSIIEGLMLLVILEMIALIFPFMLYYGLF